MRISKRDHCPKGASINAHRRKIGDMRKTLKFSWLFRMLACLGLVCASFASAQTSANLSSRFLARGEYARLEITSVGREPDFSPTPPAAPNVRVESGRMGMVSRTSNNQDLEFSYEFVVSSDVVGRHVIPPVTLVVAGNRVQSPPVEFWVFDPDKLQLSEVEIGEGRTIRYYAGFHTAKPSAYEGETMPAEIKIYVPVMFARGVLDWGVPEFERDGVTSWRFEPNDLRDVLQAYIGGQPYAALAYPSSLAPSRSGKVGIGPATLRLTSRVIINEGFLRQGQKETFLQIPKLEFDSIPLPPGAPEGFENAIGQFTIASATVKTELTEGESLAINLQVRGRGNLDALKAPKLADTKGWKLYDPISIPRGDERRMISGVATFHQGLLPMEIKSMIPPFRLVYFDPEDAIYKTTTSEPIPIMMLPSTKAPGVAAGPPPALAMPIERMNDILALVTPRQLTIPATPALPSWTAHAIGGLVALLLILKAAWMRIAPRFHKDPVQERRNRELSNLSKIPVKDDVTLLRAAGAYIEHWHGKDTDPALLEILAERDRVCFRADRPAGDITPKGRRDEILRTLRKASTTLAILFLTACFTGQMRAQDIAADAAKAFEESKYEDAIKLWQSAGDHRHLSPDILYNIGNASYRMGSPGHAALYYRRALLKDSAHAEARQNLRFIERKHGSITVQYSNYQYALAKLPINGWKNILWSGAWLTVLSLLIFPATLPDSRMRVAAAIFLVIGPLVASAGALGWRYYPNDSVFAPVERQAVFVAPKAVLYADAARTAPEIIDAPEGSLCEIIRISGKWAYVSFATKTRGWVPVSSIEKIIPDKAPGVPKIDRSALEDNNA
jgi:tetratricopeptide (TPR) repeat protein